VVRNLGVKTWNVGGSRTAGDAFDQPVENSIVEKGTALIKLRERESDLIIIVSREKEYNYF